MSNLVETCEKAARLGGQVLLGWRGRFEVREKGPSDLVTQADVASQDAIRKVVLAEYPAHAFLGEEDTAVPAVEADYCWLVDPLDGTMNYVHGVPHFAVSVAVAHLGQVVAGTIYDPVGDECFTAARGQGAFLNKARIAASTATRLSDALVAASFSARISPDSPEIAQFLRVMSQCQGVRRTGSAALNLCYVAAGRFDAFWSMSTKVWDIAAGALLVEEAGGVVTDLDGSRLRLSHPLPVASCGAQLHAEFRKLLQV